MNVVSCSTVRAVRRSKMTFCRANNKQRNDACVVRGKQVTTKTHERLQLLQLLGITGITQLVMTTPLAHARELVVPGIVGDSPLREGFVSGLLLIFFSEIGDKTFFIALLLALQQSRSTVFTGTFGALAVMTFISVGLGRVLHQIDEVLPEGLLQLPLDDILACVLLVVFGIQTLQGAQTADATAAEEKEEAQEVVAGLSGDGLALVLSTFTLVFAAEWGDKSFLATIALSAASSPVGVLLGSIAGHGVATAIAVLGGSVLSKYINEKTASYVGGSLFLVFAAATLIDIVKEVQR
eukprot:TRINITY_DN5942_c0_g1_i3.p2 TRINITY_DN5942_c0_g1~~TRINITY_DN5942_c0_g1_i3.p2  ORF type:complete len:295 (-),score=64.41 TRINITY_DN5942_c0_g1_i3:233-1117(-)